MRRLAFVWFSTCVFLMGCNCAAPGGHGARPDGAADDDGGSGNGGDAGQRVGGDGGSASDAGAGRDGGGSASDGGGAPACGDHEICGNGVDDDCNGLADDLCVCEVGATQRCYNGPRQYAGVGVCREGTQTCVDNGTEFPAWGPCEGETGPSDEVCEGTADENCNGVIDDGCGCTPDETRPCYTGASSTLNVGTCVGGMQTCIAMGTTADWGPCVGEITPRPELCDGMDYDCDGAANTGCVCVIGTSRACYDGPTGTSGVGICHDGLQSCVAGPGGVGAMWGPCTGEVVPEPDTCDGIDHTCTGVPGAGCSCILGSTRPCYGGPPATRGVGECHDGTNTCVNATSGATWSTSCSGEQQPVTEVCDNGRDDDCDGSVDEGCGGTIMCPGDVTVPAGQPITLTPTASDIVSFTWTIVSAPSGGASTAVWSPTPPRSASETFTPYIVGVYTIQITGTDAGGRSVTCMFNVTALPHGLRVQLTWNGSGDLDLHLHDNVTSQPWFTNPDDCYYSNRSPAWGASLDFDNTSSNGPENISMDSPVIGVDYTIAVHNYARGSGRLATINVFCGSTTSTVPTQTFTSRTLAGTDAGNCTSNDFWTVARVRFTSASACTITPIDTYRASSSACGSF